MSTMRMVPYAIREVEVASPGGRCGHYAPGCLCSARAQRRSARRAARSAASGSTAGIEWSSARRARAALAGAREAAERLLAIARSGEWGWSACAHAAARLLAREGPIHRAAARVEPAPVTEKVDRLWRSTCRDALAGSRS